jgi:hypothetical protein
MQIRSWVAIPLAAILPPLSAQVDKVAPVGFGYETKAGENGTSTPFATTWARNQQLIDFGALGFASGAIQSIAFRRSTSTASFAASTETVTVHLGYSGHTPFGMPPSFRQVPKGTPTLFFQGTLNLPAAPVGAPPYQWSVVITGSAPFPFSNSSANGRSLLIDIESSSASDNSWIRDARWVAGDSTAGTYAPFGTSCNGSNGRTVSPALAPSHTAVPGRAMTLYSFGWALPVKTAVAFLGTQTGSPFPIDLTPLGMTNCKLFHDVPLVQTVATEYPSATYTRAYSYWPIPPNPAFGGVTVYNQWAALDAGANPANIITSNAIRVTTGIAGTNPYTTQSNWQYTPNVDAASQSAYEYGTIVRFSGALQ